MTRRHQWRPAPLRQAVGATWAVIIAATCPLALAADSGPQALTLRRDGTAVLKFQGMTRVWVTNPEVIDVVVVSYSQLLVYTKGAGRAKLYVWDDEGRHEFSVVVRNLPAAEQVSRELAAVLGGGLRYTVVDDSTVLVDGEVASEGEHMRISKIIEAKGGPVRILDLVIVRTTHLAPAEEYRAAYQKLFPDQFRYSVIDDRTLVVEGDVASAADKQRLDKVVAATTGVQVVNLVRCREGTLSANQQLVAGLKAAAGPSYQYQPVGDSILVISGVAPDQAEKERLDKITASVSKELTVVNVVRLKSDLTPPSANAAAALRSILGPSCKVTLLGDKLLVLEGTAPNPKEEEKAAKLAEVLKEDASIVNLYSVVQRTPAERAVAMLTQILDNGFQARAVGEDAVIVEGTARGAAGRGQLEKVLAAVPSQVKVIDLASPPPGAAGASEAARYQEVLKPILGETITYRVLDSKTLLIEGEVSTAGQKDRADKIIQGLGGQVTLLNLITVKPGPDAMAQSPAARKAEELAKVLGDGRKAYALDEKTVVVEGVTASDAEQQRLSGIIEKLAGDVRVVSLLVPRAELTLKAPARRAVEAYSGLVGPTVKLVAVDDKTVLFEGIVPTLAEKDRVEKVAQFMTQSGGVSALSLVTTEAQSKTRAARRIEVLKKILGDQFNYIVWDEDTVLVEGSVITQQELDRVHKILEASSNDWRVGDLVTLASGGKGGAAPPVKEIAEAIGEPYRVWLLKGNKVVVEGVAPDAVAMHRLQELLRAYQGDADIVNLVTVAPEPVVPVVARTEALRAVLGDGFQVRVLQGKTVVVEGTVLTKEEADRARSIIQAMGQDISIVDLVTVANPAKRQVVVHCKVLEINRGALQNLDLNFGQLVQGQSSGTVTFGDQPILFQLERGVKPVSSLAANLKLLEVKDQARVLSEPNLVANEGEQAEMVVGGEVPIPVPQLGTGASSVGIEYKQYGVILSIKPTIAPSGKTLTLNIEVESSAVDTATQVSIGGIQVPAFRSRKVKTIVDMPDASTLLIGGLLQNNQSATVTSIPFLSKLPVIGALFRSRDWRLDKTELVILVTPEILKPTKP